MIILYAVIAVLVILTVTVLARTAAFRPEQEETVSTDAVDTDDGKIVRDMQDMIRCRTVSNRDEALVDREEFAKFEKLLEERFPQIHRQCEKKKIGKTGLLFKLKGLSDEKPSVCMAHYDVVPADQSEWSIGAFDGTLKDGKIWGRGTLDTKGTLCAVMEAVEKLISEGFVPADDLYLSFSGEEEIDGDSCDDIVTYLQENGIKPAFVLDEGGAVVSGAFPGMKEDCAAVGVVEKGSVNLDLIVERPGGHASTPPAHSNIGILADAVRSIERHPFSGQLTPPVRKMFETLGRHSSFGLRMIFANLWLFWPLFNVICKRSGGDMYALTRTTVAVTRAEGSAAYNVMPSKATAGLNLRLLGTDTIGSAMTHLKKVIDDDRVKIELVNGSNPSLVSDTECDEWNTLRGVIEETWPGTVVSPYLMMACSDSRHYCRITDRVYRFCGQKLSKEERGMIHGVNERIPVETLIKTVVFYTRLIKKL